MYIHRIKKRLINLCIFDQQNRQETLHVERTGGSLSLSENEFDSDELEDLSLTLKYPKPKKSHKIQHSKRSSIETISRTTFS